MENSINSDLIRGHINTIILKALFEGDKYGYEICKEISERTMGQYILKQPTLYSCLKRMEKSGFIKSYWGVGATGGGQRRYYAMTELGKDIYLKNQKEWEFSRTIIDNLVSDKRYDLNQPTQKKEYNKAMKALVGLEKEYEEIEKNMTDEDYAADNQDDDVDIDLTISALSKELLKKEEKIKDIIQDVSENQQIEDDGQYDMFKNLDADIDEKIYEYDRLKKNRKVFSKKSQEELDLSKENYLQENRDIAAYKAMLENMNKNKSKVGFDAMSSKFLIVPTPQSYTDAILTHDKPEMSENIEETRQETAEIVNPKNEVKSSLERNEKVFYVEHSASETKAEKEYRTILNKLLLLTKNHIVNDNGNPPEKITTAVSAVSAQDSEKSEKVEGVLKNTEKKKIEEIAPKNIEDEKVIPYRARESGDFANIQSKMQTEGFKIRVRESQKMESKKTPEGFAKMSMLLLSTSLIIFVFALTEIAVMYFAIKQFQMSFTLFIILACSSLAIPALGGIGYAYYKNRKVNDRFKFSISFFFGIIIAIAIYMVCISIAFLTGATFSEGGVIMQNVVLPAILALNIPISIIVYTLLKKKYR